MLFVSQDERRTSDTVLFTSENNDIANQSIDTSFFNSEKNFMTNQLASLVRRDYFYLDAFWRVNLSMYIIMIMIMIMIMIIIITIIIIINNNNYILLFFSLGRIIHYCMFAPQSNNIPSFRT